MSLVPSLTITEPSLCEFLRWHWSTGGGDLRFRPILLVTATMPPFVEGLCYQTTLTYF